MRATGLSERELSGELSGMLSRLGFLKSFDDEQLDEAKTATEEAIRIGDADGWVTKWNLAHITARGGDISKAQEHLTSAIAAANDWNSSTASILVFVPGRQAADCMIAISPTGLSELLELQAAVFAAVEQDDDQLSEVVGRCEKSDDPAVVCAADWIAKSFGTAVA
jgi:hypothetical protein